MFIPHMWHNESEPWELIPAEAGMDLEVGQALTMEGGTMAKATGSAAPTHICMEKAETTVKGQKIHAERVRPETVYETELAAESAGLAVGAKFGIDAAGEKLTAEDGAAEVVSFDGTSTGNKVRVRFS